VPFHRDLRLAGLLPPVDAPHHMRAMEWRPYREGAVVSADPETGSLIDVGLYETVSMPLIECEPKFSCVWKRSLLYSPTCDAAFGGRLLRGPAIEAQHRSAECRHSMRWHCQAVQTAQPTSADSTATLSISTWS
jgi:Putative RNA methyltransferase